MSGEVKWVSRSKVKWFVARHGSKFVYVELKATYRRGKPLIVRSIRAYGKGGTSEILYSEVYDLPKAEEIVEAERALIRLLKASDDDKDVVKELREVVFSLESNLNLLKVMVEKLEESVGGGGCGE
ncbi:MAG: hypothetical protein DRN15_01270 [Thermoprotei archaeon]|nr:MAG: hypothetical protein DRN15_01270 [Thermoprotei archaeon]RLF25796.1 MAG: hypothetical protein DRM97_00545 [Thermoprotei archaeon]